MRILGVSKKWDKLRLPEWTTFRFARKDKDWYVGKVVQVFYKPRSKGREFLGIAKIVSIKQRHFGLFNIYDPRYLTIAEAQEDGFIHYTEMKDWFYAQYGKRIYKEPINRLTLAWKAIPAYE